MKAKEMAHWKGVWKVTDDFGTLTTFDSTVDRNLIKLFGVY